MMWILDELKKIEVQPEVINRPISEIRRSSPEIYKSLVIGAYVDGKINLSKAAELLGVTRIELQRKLKEKGVPIRVPSKEDVTAEAEAAKRWEE
jgi:predicted HTH domain antitoxin